MDQRGHSVRTVLAAGALGLLAVLLVGTAGVNLAGVNRAVDAALRRYPGERYFIEAYQSGALAIPGLVLALAIAATLLVAAMGVLGGRRWGRTLGLTVPWLTLCCGLGALTTNPVSGIRWSGDPDGVSLVRDHFPDWHWPVVQRLLVLMVLCCLVTTVLLALPRGPGTASRRSRPDHPPSRTPPP